LTEAGERLHDYAKNMYTSTMAKDLFAKALSLPVNKRAQLAHELIVSLDDGKPDPEAAEAWDLEIERRVTDFRAGKSKAIPWDRARADILRRLGAKRPSKRSAR
jgi:putative addiction module component (TIGR02574 family)